MKRHRHNLRDLEVLYTLAPYKLAVPPADAALPSSTNAFEDVPVTAVQDPLRLKIRKAKAAD